MSNGRIGPPWWLMARGTGGSRTVSGPVAHWEDKVVAPLRSLLVNIEPVQDLHGYDNPWPAGGGKNKANITAETIQKPAWYTGSWYGTILNDKHGITQNRGYQQGGAGGFHIVNLPAGVYTFSMTFSGTTQQCRFFSSCVDGNGNVTNIVTNLGMLKNGTRYYYVFTVPDGTIDLVFRPTIWSANESYELEDIQIESGSTPTTFAPYSNICPISGWASVDVMHSGADTSDPTVYTIQLGQTVYGGTLDVTNGVLTVTHEEVDLGSFNWIDAGDDVSRITINMSSVAYEQDILCSSYKAAPSHNYAQWGNATIGCTNSAEYNLIRVKDARFYGKTGTEIKSIVTGIKAVWKLATPITIPLTPTEISTLQGQNNVWADSGDVTVTYLSGEGNPALVALALAHRIEE